jgi:hypothetical protein
MKVKIKQLLETQLERSTVVSRIIDNHSQMPNNILLDKDALYRTRYQEEVDKGQATSVSNLISRLFGASQTEEEKQVNSIVASISLRLDLTLEQHKILHKLTQNLAPILSKHTNKVLDESLLLDILQAEQGVKESILSERVTNTRQHQNVIQSLVSLQRWFASLHQYQRQIVSDLQQRNFRLSMG